MLIYALLGVALTMLLGWGGQVSLGNFALVGLGAYLTARWADGLDAVVAARSWWGSSAPG